MHDIIVKHRPNLMFIHFDSIDEAGHAHQWGSPDYYAAAKVQCAVSCTSSQQSVSMSLIIIVYEVEPLMCGQAQV